MTPLPRTQNYIPLTTGTEFEDENTYKGGIPCPWTCQQDRSTRVALSTISQGGKKSSFSTLRASSKPIDLEASDSDEEKQSISLLSSEYLSLLSSDYSDLYSSDSNEDFDQAIIECMSSIRLTEQKAPSPTLKRAFEQEQKT